MHTLYKYVQKKSKIYLESCQQQLLDMTIYKNQKFELNRKYSERKEYNNGKWYE